MGRCIASIQEPGRGEQHRARTNAGERFRPGGAVAQPVKKYGVVQMVPESPAAGDEHDVQVWTVRERMVGQDLHAARRGDRAGVLGHEHRVER